MSDDPLLSGLNPAQREAVLSDSSRLLILAGAGSGKTRVITVKIAYLIARLGVDPRSILAVTFTNKAAAEMRERAAAMAPEAAGVMVRTFHSFGAWMLRRNADAVGLPRGFSIYDDDDSATLLATILENENRATVRSFTRLISRAKDYALAPDDDLRHVSGQPELPSAYQRYQAKLEQIGSVDFGDLILRPVQLLRSEPAIRSRIAARFRYVLVDEYQDSNVAQYELLKLLVDEESYLCVVGDDDQSIYRFRGAEVRNILTFADSFPGTHVIRLEQNYRSCGSILDVADAVVRNNASRLGKTLWTQRESGPRPRYTEMFNQDAEVEYALQLIAEAPGSHTAILYRTNAQSRLFETALLSAGVAYQIVGTVRFYEREEIKDALALLRLLANPRDEVSFRRVINKPARGIGTVSIERLIERAAGGDLPAAAADAGSVLSKRAASAGAVFAKVIREAGERLSGGGQLSEVVERLVRESGIHAHHAEGSDPVIAQGRVENLDELQNAASLYPASTDGLVEFLEVIELDQARLEQEVVDAKVTLITMHNTKGLEFDRVIITGLEDGLFPRSDEESVDDLEEERRLFYVAITRARNELYLTSCRTRRVHGRMVDLIPSRFLSEIPVDLLDTGPAGGIGRAASPDYPVGAAVYHDEYGPGQIAESWITGQEPVVVVHFESGRSARFLPRYTPLERIAADEWS